MDIIFTLFIIIVDDTSLKILKYTLLLHIASIDS